MRALVLLNAHGGNELRALVRELQPGTPIILSIVNWWQAGADLATALVSLATAVVLTMVIAGTDFTTNIRKELEKTEFPVLKTEIGNRVAYMRSLLRSNTVLGDENRKAWEEMANLGKELISLLQSSYGNR